MLNFTKYFNGLAVMLVLSAAAYAVDDMTDDMSTTRSVVTTPNCSDDQSKLNITNKSDDSKSTSICLDNNHDLHNYLKANEGDALDIKSMKLDDSTGTSTSDDMNKNTDDSSVDLNNDEDNS